MACNPKIWAMVSFMLLPLPSVMAAPKVPCLFILGDSSFDNGNNNNLTTTAKANYPPYGIDFPEGPTGRFTNGRNLADFIAKLLRFGKPIPPFVNAKDHDILTGVNYASGAAGIRYETGSQLGDRIWLSRQLLNHETTVARIATLLGSEEAAANYLSKCIYLVNIGSNDYINNYLMPEYYNTSLLYNPSQYATVLLQEYSQQLKSLYDYGARKIALFGLGQIGCIPFEKAKYGAKGSSCVEMINKDVQLFDKGLNSLVNKLNRNLNGARFIYISITKISSADPFGLVTSVPCCKLSTTIAKGQCAPNEVPCRNRKTHVFWDGYHPNQVSNRVLANRAYSHLRHLILAV